MYQSEAGGRDGSDLFFVVGCPRSGTTLMSVVLDRHSLMSVPPETAFCDELLPRWPGPDHAALGDLLGSWRRLPELGLDVNQVLAGAKEDLSPASVLRSLVIAYGRQRNAVRFGEKRLSIFCT